MRTQVQGNFRREQGITLFPMGLETINGISDVNN